MEDNPADARLLREAIKETEDISIILSHADTLTQALARITDDHFDVIMLDLSLPDEEGLETLVRMHAQAPNVPIVVLTGLDDEGLAMRAVREGAQDYLVKGQVTSRVLVRSMRYATERKRAIEELQRSEEYFRSLIENALDIITVLDEKGIVRYGSPSIERVMGYQASALIWDNFSPSSIPTTGASFWKNFVVELRLRCHAENRSWSAAPGWQLARPGGDRQGSDRNSAVGGFVLNSRDITERKRAEEALREANQTLRAVIRPRHSPSSPSIWRGYVKSWNERAEAIFGYAAAEVIDEPLPIVSPDDQADFRRGWRNLPSRGTCRRHRRAVSPKRRIGDRSQPLERTVAGRQRTDHRNLRGSCG